MAENKKKILVYADWLINFKDLSNEELGQLMRHFFEYINDLNPVLEDRLLKIAWNPIEATLKRDLKKWKQFTDKQSVNGSLGGRPAKTKETQITQAFFKKPKKAVSVSVSVSDNVNVNVNDSKEELREAAPKSKLLIWLENNCPSVQKLKEPMNDEQALKLLADYPNHKELIREKFLNMENNLGLNKNYKSANLTVRAWLNRDLKKENETKPREINYPRL